MLGSTWLRLVPSGLKLGSGAAFVYTGRGGSRGRSASRCRRSQRSARFLGVASKWGPTRGAMWTFGESRAYAV